MNHPPNYSFTHQLIYSFTHTILSKTLRQSAVSAERNRVNQQNKKMQNEPNLNQINNSLIYPFTHLLIDSIMQNEPNLVLSEVEWIKQITHFINEQRTKNHKQFSNEPNLNPILPAILSIYAIGCSLDGKYLGVLCALCGFKQKMQNEPNLKNTKINVTSLSKMVCVNFHPLAHQKNEPNLCNTKSINNSLIYSFTHLLINAIMQNEPNFAQRTSSIKYPKSSTEQKMSNEPNFRPGQLGNNSNFFFFRSLPRKIIALNVYKIIIIY